MTFPHIDKAQIGRYYTGVLFATTLLMAGSMFASLVGLWKLRLLAPDLTLQVIGLGIMGGVGFLATVVNLWRLRRKLRSSNL